jgi:hypothetical protein
MGFGGPVWHASAAPLSAEVDRYQLKKRAFSALHDVGDKSLGQWEEWTGKAYHVRRRLSAKEESITGPMLDIRGTKEALERVEQLLRKSPFLSYERVFEEAGLKLSSMPQESFQ